MIQEASVSIGASIAMKITTLPAFLGGRMMFEQGQTWNTNQNSILLFVREVTKDRVTFVYLGSTRQLRQEQNLPDSEVIRLSVAQATAEEYGWNLIATTGIS
jgi:hypothetical protein